MKHGGGAFPAPSGRLGDRKGAALVNRTEKVLYVLLFKLWTFGGFTEAYRTDPLLLSDPRSGAQTLPVALQIKSSLISPSLVLVFPAASETSKNHLIIQKNTNKPETNGLIKEFHLDQ